MKTYLNWGVSLLLVLGVSASMSSCKKSDDSSMTPGNDGTVNGVISTDPNYTYLQAAIARAGWNDTLRNGNFTLFAPTDSAFRQAGFTSTSAFSNYTADSLRRILRYHIVTTRYAAADLPSGSNTELTTLGGSKLYITKNSNGTFINGNKLVRTDGSATNGVIQGINGVLIPAYGNLSQLIARDTTYSYLNAALRRVGTSNTALSSALTGTTPYTVFAPTNAAFRAAGYTTGKLDSANVTMLTNLLAYHVIPGRVFSSDFTTGNVTTVGGGTFALASGTNGGYTITGAGNGTNVSNIGARSTLASNGLYYSVDQVLLPASTGTGTGGR